MSETYRYVLLLAVDEHDLQALCAMNQFPGGLQPSNSITIVPVQVEPYIESYSTLSIAPIVLPGVSVADANMKFAWYTFPDHIGRDAVIASTQTPEFNAFIQHCRHFAVYSIATRP